MYFATLGDVVSNVAQSDDGGAIVRRLAAKIVLNSLQYLREQRVVQVGHIYINASNRALGLLRRAFLGHPLADRRQHLHYFRELLIYNTRTIEMDYLRIFLEASLIAIENLN